jgi:hypothetical protein
METVPHPPHPRLYHGIQRGRRPQQDCGPVSLLPCARRRPDAADWTTRLLARRPFLSRGHRARGHDGADRPGPPDDGRRLQVAGSRIAAGRSCPAAAAGRGEVQGSDGREGAKPAARETVSVNAPPKRATAIWHSQRDAHQGPRPTRPHQRPDTRPRPYSPAHRNASTLTRRGASTHGGPDRQDGRGSRSRVAARLGAQRIQQVCGCRGVRVLGEGPNGTRVCVPPRAWRGRWSTLGVRRWIQRFGAIAGRSEFELPCRNPNAICRLIKALDLVD